MKLKAILSAFLLVGSAIVLTAAVEVVPGFQVCGIYVDCDGSASMPGVFYRKLPEGKWQKALPLCRAEGEKQARGSIFGLTENAQYELKVESKPEIRHRFSTLARMVPIAETITLPSGGPLILRKSGRPDGYIRYTAASGAVIDGGGEAEAAILLSQCKYVILDGLTVRGGRRYGIKSLDSQYIRIINCDVSGYGRTGEFRITSGVAAYRDGDMAINYDGGISLFNGGPILVERSRVHDPRISATPWFYAHPCGPSAIFVRGVRQLAVRYNDLAGSSERRWNDAIEGGANGSVEGGAWRDAEICGNFLAFGNDDGMELDGGQINTRFFGNRSEGMLSGVSTAPCLVGPSYCYRNLFCEPGDGFGFVYASIKNNYSDIGTGEVHLINNTLSGSCAGISHFGGRSPEIEKLRNCRKGYSRNNIIAVTGGAFSKQAFRHAVDFDHDWLASGLAVFQKDYKQELDGVEAAIEFKDPASGDYRPARIANAWKGEVIEGITGAVPFPGAADPELSTQFPLRPTPFGTDRSTLRFHWNDEVIASQTVTLTALQPRFNSSFKVVKGDTANYLKVTPSEGILESGRPVTLTVSVDPAEIKRAELLCNALSIRLPDGSSRPIAVYVDATGSSKLLARDRKEAIRGSILSRSKQGAKIEFTVPQAGKYYLFAVSGKIPQRISVKVNDAELPRRRVWAAPSSVPRWTNIGVDVYAGFANEPIEFPAGRSVVEVETDDAWTAGPFALAVKPETFMLAPHAGLE